MSNDDDGYILNRKHGEPPDLEDLQKRMEEHEEIQKNFGDGTEEVQEKTARSLKKSNFPVPASEESGNAAVDSIEKKYMQLFSESMSAESRANIYSFLTTLRIRPDDALCSALLCMQYYDNRLQKFPARLELTVSKVLQEVRDECSSAAMDESKKVKKEILRLINDHFDNGGNKSSKWKTPTCISLYILFGFVIGQCFTRLPIINSLLNAIYN